MRWTSKDIDVYLNAKEYIDTALIPLIPISLESDMKSSVAQGEFISILTNELERHFKGRLIHFPAFTYLKSEQNESVARLKNWVDTLHSNNMKHVILLTADIDWKQFEDKFDCTLMWLPALPLGQMDDSQQTIIIKDQINQLIPVFTKKWSSENS